MKRQLQPVIKQCCALILLAWALPAVAEALSPLAYDIVLNAPSAQHKLLEKHLDLYRWRGNTRMDEVQLQRLVSLAPAQIREYLATEGYYAPIIDADLDRAAGRWVVRLSVAPGEPVRVQQVELHVAGAFDEGSARNRARLEKMRADWSLPLGAPFRHGDWETAKRNAVKALLLEGYPTATIVQSQATVDPETAKASLLVKLDSGPAVTLGRLDIQGLQRYPPSVIERMNPLRPGESYSQARLLDFQSRLQDSPYFASAAVSVDLSTGGAAAVPVQVEVTENPSRKLGFGTGISTDTGVRGQIEYRDINLLDRAWRLGGTLKLEQQRQSLGGDIQFPLTGQGYRDSVNTLLERTDIEGELTSKLVLGVQRTFLRGKTETTYGVRYFLEQQRIDGAESARSATLSPFYAWTVRDVDHLLYPTRGYVLKLQADAAAQVLLSDQDFVRGAARGIYFHSLSERDQLILRGELGIVAADSNSDIPSDFLFRTGGDQTIRGYDYLSLGVPEGDAIVGGRYLLAASLEYVRWLTPKWGAAAFVDGGNAVDRLGELTPVYGYGLGARWKSPVGPVNLDVAYGEDSGELRLHFSMGFNF